ncbi:GV typeII chitinase [Glossina pallidipes salivary gland hypertrophy virus]|uniref:GV typeII chitinase n=1 Tax=Glossina hytrovirus (isolate Glossina pallidipes/Ethiopia/Seibersdorf/-) TaxID=379529 RepID=A0A0Y0KFN3_GHVS|nr:GV typeII chitinase [Glossina pallidipes salivary gland hypertrophy virus]
MQSLISILLLFLLYTISNASHQVIYCNYNTTSFYRDGEDKFEPERINPFLCTHIGYSHFSLSKEFEVYIENDWLHLQYNIIKKVTDLKAINPNLKVIATLGDGNSNEEQEQLIETMLNDAANRKNFIIAVFRFLKLYNFDGINLHWQQPLSYNFTLLVKEMQNSFVTTDLQIITTQYFIEDAINLLVEISKYVNYVNLKTFDYINANSCTVQLNSPMDKIEHTVNALANIDNDKLIIGIPMFGYLYDLLNKKQYTPGSPRKGNSRLMLSYCDICLNTNSWQKEWDIINQVPYRHTATGSWLTFDNDKSIRTKVEFFHKYGGFGVWSLDLDDFRGKCTLNYPMLRVINAHIHSKQQSAQLFIKPNHQSFVIQQQIPYMHQQSVLSFIPPPPEPHQTPQMQFKPPIIQYEQQPGWNCEYESNCITPTNNKCPNVNFNINLSLCSVGNGKCSLCTCTCEI